jgi:hypothetical protein
MCRPSDSIGDRNDMIKAAPAAAVVDRIHTALHGHVLARCEAVGIEVDRETTMNRALKLRAVQAPGAVRGTRLIVGSKAPPVSDV